jgi:hypothetical protein
MFPPGEAWQGKGLAGGTLDTGGAAATAALSGLGKNDLTNLKLASNQQVCGCVFTSVDTALHADVLLDGS